MTDEQKTKPTAGSAETGDEGGYDASAIEVLAAGASRRRPWQLLMTDLSALAPAGDLAAVGRLT